MATTRKTTTKTSTSKSTTSAGSAVSKAKAAAAKTASSAATPDTSVVVNAPQPVVSGPVMRKRELIDAVVAKSGIKKKDAKPVVEAMLHVLGAALQDGRELNLQPLGKVKVNREKKMAEGKVLITKIRQARDLPASPVAAEQEAVDEIDAPAAAE
ncbi:HU family DNA-binding protein [uncultured Tateyamaria sp.]|uniref:HU family DNA-binding protein n=1 Tax=Tateyamaria sp. TaxID=1929288 RepID=UPI00262392F1|nr:HU family DNA-binding protein [uncultured Tateyamaria sp.]